LLARTVLRYPVAKVLGVPEETLTIHLWTDGSFRKSAGFGWIATADDKGAGDVIAQGSQTLKGHQVAFDAEIAAIEDALK